METPYMQLLYRVATYDVAQAYFQTWMRTVLRVPKKLYMHSRYCTCRYNVARARTSRYIITPTWVHGCTRRQVAALCKWELNGMLVGMQGSSLQGARCIIELRTLRCNGWAWRFRGSPPFLFTFARLSARARGMTTTARGNPSGSFFIKLSANIRWHFGKLFAIRVIVLIQVGWNELVV